MRVTTRIFGEKKYCVRVGFTPGCDQITHIAAGDVKALVPNFQLVGLMGTDLQRAARACRRSQLFIPVTVLQKWVEESRKADRSEQAKYLSAVVQWASALGGVSGAQAEAA